MEPGSDGEGKNRYKVTVQLDSTDLAYGQRVSERVTVRTTSERIPKVEIPVGAIIVGDLYVTSPVVHFGYLHPNRDAPRSLLIENNNPDLLVEITDIRYLPGPSEKAAPDMELSWEPVENSSNFRINAVLHVGENPEALQGRIEVKTTHPEQKALYIDVRSILAPKKSSARNTSGSEKREQK
jgi:hypothetical protein